SGGLAAIETQRPAPLQSGLLDPMGDAVAGADGELLLQPVATTPSRHAKPPASLRVRARGRMPPGKGAKNPTNALPKVYPSGRAAGAGAAAAKGGPPARPSSKGPVVRSSSAKSLSGRASLPAGDRKRTRPSE